jgi:uncharacterized protein YbcV (DUF1398 family)
MSPNKAGFAGWKVNIPEKTVCYFAVDSARQKVYSG